MSIQIADTVICDSTSLLFDIEDLNGNVYGEKVYHLNIDYLADSVFINGIQGEFKLQDTGDFIYVRDIRVIIATITRIQQLLFM